MSEPTLPNPTSSQTPKTVSIKDRQSVPSTGSPYLAPPAGGVEDQEATYRRDVLRKELSRMRERDGNARLRVKAVKKEMERKAKENMYREKIEKGITIFPETAHSRLAVRKVVSGEEYISTKDKLQALDAESSRMKTYIDQKLGISALPKGDRLMTMAADFYCKDHPPNEHIPESIRRELTSAEIDDFRMVFDMFDVKNKGYITADDLQRAAGMLGYTSKKKVFKEMISEISKDKRGRVTFISFLELVIKLQGDGPDPLEEMNKCFSMLDRGDKGYVTFSDMRVAADEMKVNLSNKAIREMMEEANLAGNGRITLDEFRRILGQTGTFRAAMPLS